MQITSYMEDESVIHVSLSGRLTYLTPFGVKSLILQISNKPVGMVIIDLNLVSFIDSAGVGYLVLLSEKLRSVGGAMSVKNAHGQVERVLTAAQVLDQFLKPRFSEAKQNMPQAVSRTSDLLVPQYCLNPDSRKSPHLRVKQLLKALMGVSTGNMLAA